MKVPRLEKGKGYKGPEFYGCYNTGMAPAIFHSRQGCYIVGPELRCRDAMRAGLTIFVRNTTHGEGRQQIWLYKSRKPAEAKFMQLCGAQMVENHRMRTEHARVLAKAKQGDMSAVLALGDY